MAISYLLLLPLLLLTACTSTSESDSPESIAAGPTPECVRQTTLGDRLICVPERSGWEEIYARADVKDLYNQMESTDNLILGVYVREGDTIPDLDSLPLRDNFLIHVPREWAHKGIDAANFAAIGEERVGGFKQMALDDMLGKMEELANDFSFGGTTLVGDEKIDDDARTLLLLNRYGHPSGRPYFTAMSLSLVRARDRLVYVTQTKPFADSSTFDVLREETAEFVAAMRRANG